MENCIERRSGVTRTAYARMPHRIESIQKDVGSHRQLFYRRACKNWRQKEDARLRAGVRARLENLRKMRFESAFCTGTTQVSGEGVQRPTADVGRRRRTRGKKLTDLRNQLILEYMDRLKSKVQKWDGKTPASLNTDELMSVCTMGLVDAAKHYVPVYRGFWRYASIRIDGHVRDYMRKEDWLPRIERARYKKAIEAGEDFEIHQQVHMKPQAELDLYQQLGCIDKRFNIIDHRDLIEKLMRGYTARERRFIQLYAIEGYTLRECGNIMGFSESRACQIWEGIVKLARSKIHE